MSKQCSATARTGAKCRATAVTGDLCRVHANPSIASELGKLSAKRRKWVNPDSDEAAAVVAPPQSASDVRQFLGQVMLDVRQRRLDPKIATCLGYLSGPFLRALELADLEVRLERLETSNGALAGRTDQELKFFALHGYFSNENERNPQ